MKQTEMKCNEKSYFYFTYLGYFYSVGFFCCEKHSDF